LPKEFGWTKLILMTQPSRLYRLIESQLDGATLADFVADRRLPTKSWREIADELRELTGETISEETLRLWFGENRAAATAVTP
jgi:hypothetical protein